MYSLECSYFEKEFNSINELVEYCTINGMDPNYEITKDGKGIDSLKKLLLHSAQPEEIPHINLDDKWITDPEIIQELLPDTSVYQRFKITNHIDKLNWVKHQQKISDLSTKKTVKTITNTWSSRKFSTTVGGSQPLLTKKVISQKS